jgi:hypothetical protein
MTVPIEQVFAFGPPAFTGVHGNYRCRPFGGDAP